MVNHLLLAYDISVIFIGSICLSFSIWWAINKKEKFLYFFSLFYLFFTLNLITSLIGDYAQVNINFKTSYFLYIVDAIGVIFNDLMILFCIIFFQIVLDLKHRNIFSLLWTLLTVLAIALVFSPIGVYYDKNENYIEFMAGYYIAQYIYFLCFTYGITISIVFFKNLNSIKKKIFMIASLIFALIGYGETISGIINSFMTDKIILRSDKIGFFISSVPYAIYSIFIVFFLNKYYSFHNLPVKGLPHDIIKKYNISKREIEIIEKILEGYSNMEIGDKLFISLATVKTHVHNIYEKTGCKSRYQLINKFKNNQ
jgi:DNA-binding CsgD family transcriptional regulator